MPAPPEIPVIDPSSPQFDDLILVESINTTKGSYSQLPRGTPHPNVAKYPGYVLVLEKPFAGDEKWMQRYYAADPVAEDTYNLAQQTFDGEDVNKEVFIRHYLVRRTEYIPANIPAKLSLLTGVIGVRVTAGGSGYDATTTVTITAAALDPGTGAAATAIVFRGAVVGIYLTAEGSGYAVAPTVTINGPAGAAGAAATARIQPVSAKLIEEKADRMEGQTEDGLYLKITRVYHTLPGAILTSYSGGAGGKLRRVRRQKIELPAFPTATDANLINQKVDALSTVVGWKTTEDWTNADGTTTGTPVPWLIGEETIEPEGVKLYTFVKTVASSVEPPAKGQSFLDTAGDMAAGGTYTGRRRIPTFPTGITNAGTWENAQNYVIHSEKKPIADSPNMTLIVQATCRPRARYVFPEFTFQFPALFTWNTSAATTALTLVNGRLPLRYDLDFIYKSHRTRRVVACLLYKYSFGQLGNLSPQWFLNSPGAGSAFFGQLDANTIYADLGAATYVQISNDSGVVEQFDFSTVTGCAQANNSVAGTDLTPAKGTLPAFYRMKAEENEWRGNFYVREYLCVAEDRDIIADAQALRFSGTDEDAVTGVSTATTTQYLYCR